MNIQSNHISRDWSAVGMPPTLKHDLFKYIIIPWWFLSAIKIYHDNWDINIVNEARTGQRGELLTRSGLRLQISNLRFLIPPFHIISLITYQKRTWRGRCLNPSSSPHLPDARPASGKHHIIVIILYLPGRQTATYYMPSNRCVGAWDVYA